MFRFPWGDMHSLNLGWFLQKFNELREDWATAEAGIDGALDAEIEKAEDALSEVFDARDAAAASATAAAGSASAAGTSATAAQNSATGAASSATLANQKATAAGLSEAAAAQSATQAGNSAAAAAGSATAAGQSATNAAGSATAADNSATAAAGSATAAGNSATAAAASAAAAEAVEESIPEDYSNLSNDVANLKTAIVEKAPLIINNANGNPILIKDGAADYSAKKVVLNVTAGSERTVKINRYGKNLFPVMFTQPTTIQGLTITPLSDGGIQISGTFTGTSNALLKRITVPADDVIMPAGVVIISKNEPSLNINLYIQAVPYTGQILFVRDYQTVEYTISNISIHYFDIFVRAEASGQFINTTLYPTLIYKQNDTSFEKFDRSTTELTIPAGSEIVTAENIITLLQGNNTIIPDEGDIEIIEYPADTKLYIDSKITELQAVVLENMGG